MFENESAKHPFEGDYILKIHDNGNSVRVRYFLDRDAMTMKIVAVVAQPFRIM